jgi:hypothetical protein
MEDSIKESTDNACSVVVLCSGAPREPVRFVYVPDHCFVVVVVVVEGKKFQYIILSCPTINK